MPVPLEVRGEGDKGKSKKRRVCVCGAKEREHMRASEYAGQTDPKNAYPRMQSRADT